MSNEELRKDEVEGLSLIYPDEWVVENAETSSYSVVLITNDGQSVQLLLHLPDGYPLDCCPIVQVSAPWMARDLKTNLIKHLDDVCLRNRGTCVLFTLIEETRQCLQDIVHSNATKSLEPEKSPAEHTESLCDVQIEHGEPLVDRKSIFQAHLAAVSSTQDVESVLNQLKLNKKFSMATHNMWAYRISNGNNTVQDCDDDGETHAGSRMLHLLQIVDAKNVIVVVSRWYGGIQLGPDRFKHINNVTRQVLIDNQYIHIPSENYKNSRVK